MKLISREKFEYISKRVLGYPLQDAEKDYFLSLFMKILSESNLKGKLVFKGGTAIYHCYLDQFRFSEDLDFTSISKNIEIIDLKELIESYDFFEVKKEFVSDATFKIEKLKYYGILDTPNSIKVEVDRKQNVFLKPSMKKYQNVWGFDFNVSVMDKIEICAEKIRACNDRFSYRDFYDLYMIVKRYRLDLNESLKILPKKEIRKPICKENIIKHLDYALGEISNKSDTVYYEEEIDSSELKEFFIQINVPDLEPNV